VYEHCESRARADGVTASRRWREARVDGVAASWHRGDGATMASYRLDAIDATARSDTPRGGPNALKFDKETTPGIVCEIRVTSTK